MDNSVGKIVTMERNLVDEDKSRTCSQGLHFCSYDYLKHFSGERIVVLKINPADIVAIPEDYNNSKGRCCSYEVIDEIPLNEYSLPAKALDAAYAVQIEATKGTEGMNTRKAYELRRALANGTSLRAAAKAFGISRRQAARIRDYECWVF